MHYTRCGFALTSETDCAGKQRLMQYRIKLITELLALALCLYCCLRPGIHKGKALRWLTAWIVWNLATEISAAISAYLLRNNLTVYSLCAPVRFILLAGYFHYSHSVIRKHHFALLAACALTVWYFLTLFIAGKPGHLNTLFLQAECIAVWLLSILSLSLPGIPGESPGEKNKRNIAISLLLSYSACFACRTFIGIGTELHYPAASIHPLYLLTYLFGILPYPWIALSIFSESRQTKSPPHV